MTEPDNNVSIDELRRRSADLVSRFERLADRLDSTYIRREVFDAFKEIINLQFTVLNKTVDDLVSERSSKNRLVWSAIVSGFGSIVVAIILFVILHNGGGR